MSAVPGDEQAPKSESPSREGPESARAKLFISYSRKDRSFVEHLAKVLGDGGHDVWVDLEGIQPSDDWLNAIRAAIEGADAFVFAVSPDSVDPGSICGQEIDHAVQHNKRIIPIVCRAVDTRAIRVPEAIGKLNWLSFSDADGFDLSVKKLVATIELDLDWVKRHTRLLERAVEWDAEKRDSSFLLQKNDLAAAEKWLAQGPTKDPKPTALQTQYVIDARTAATKRQRLIRGALIVGLAITAAAAAVALYQRDEAITQARIALSRQLASQAQSTVAERPSLLPVSALLAVESLKRHPTLEADQVLRQGLPLLPRAGAPPIKLRGPVQALAFSPVGARLAAASRDGTAGAWQADTGRQAFPLKIGQEYDRLNGMAFSPNGALLATADSGGNVQIWNAEDGRPLGQPMMHQAGRTPSVAFSADDNYLAVVSDYGADVWQIGVDGGVSRKVFSTPHTVTTFPCVPLSSFVFSPTGKHAAAACRGNVAIWEVGSWKLGPTIAYENRPGLLPPQHPIAFSFDGKYLASADEIREVETGALFRPLYSQDPVSSVAFSHDGSYLAMAAGDTVRLVDPSKGTSFAVLRHAREVRAVAISPRDDQIATAGNDDTARIWQVNKYDKDSPSPEVTRISHSGPVTAVVFGLDGKVLATASDDGTVGVWQASPVQAGKTYGSKEQSVVFMTAAGRFLVTSTKHAVQVHDVADGRKVGPAIPVDPADPTIQLDGARLSDDGRYLWTAGHHPRARPGRGSPPEVQKTARVWDVARGAVAFPIEYESKPNAAMFSADGTRLVVSDGPMLRIWNVTEARELTPIKSDNETAAFSPDGTHLILVGPKAIRVLETREWREVRTLPLDEHAPGRPFAFSPDSKSLAVAWEKNVQIWELAGNRKSQVLPVASAISILFAPIGNRIAIAKWDNADSSDRSVGIWDSDDLREIDRLPLPEIERTPNVRIDEAGLAFSRDSHYLALENQGLLHLWDIQARREAERWMSGYTSLLAFTPDGKSLLSMSNGTVLISSWDTEAIIAEACARLDRNLDDPEWRQYLRDEPYRKTCPNIR